MSTEAPDMLEDNEYPNVKTITGTNAPELIIRCTWIQDGDPDSDTWATDCGNMFVLNEGTPKENDLKFCCYCGKPLEEEKLTWEELDAQHT